jgi:nucleoid-associated protein YgaU
MFTLPALRNLVGWTVGAGMITATMLRTAPATAVNTPPPTIIMTRTPEVTSTTAGTFEPPVASAAAPSVPREDATWTARPGDSFWSIAQEVVALQGGREPADREIVAYWRVLIDANRSLLADAENADLIFAGQIFRLPPMPQAG